MHIRTLTKGTPVKAANLTESLNLWNLILGTLGNTLTFIAGLK